VVFIPGVMRSVRAAAFAAALLGGGTVLGGCGAGSAPGSPAVAGVPLAAHTRLIAGVRSCDGGAHPFCARELVLVAARRGPRHYASSTALLAAEGARLRRAGWSSSKGDTDAESAAESPSHRLRLTYATAADDLRSLDEGRITRARRIAHTLAEQLYAGAPALSLMLQAGSS
jgi:hypothetical protein